MAEGESGYHYDSITGKVLRCYWDLRIHKELKKYKLIEETSLPVSGKNCLKCSLEKCLDCNNYCPSTKTYPKKK